MKSFGGRSFTGGAERRKALGTKENGKDERKEAGGQDIYRDKTYNVLDESHEPLCSSRTLLSPPSLDILISFSTTISLLYTWQTSLIPFLSF